MAQIMIASQPWVNSTFHSKADETTADALRVHLAGAETITGAKTFTGGMSVSGAASFTGEMTVPAATDASADNAPATVKYVKDKVSTLFEYKGSKATYADLPASGNNTGDVWNVEEDGANYAWSGTAWDKLSEDLSGFAVDSAVVHKTGDEQIAGAKTFSGAASFGSTVSVTGAASLNGGATVPTGKTLTLTDAPTANTDAANKKYVDDSVAPLATDSAVVHLTGSETISGAKTFSGGATVPTGAALTLADAPTNGTDAVNKTYADGLITALANDTRLVHTSGNESIAGTKTFSAEVSLSGGAAVPTGKSITIADAPAEDTDAANKAYVDGKISDLVPSSIAYVDEANSFTAAQSFGSTVSVAGVASLNGGATVPTGKTLTLTDAPTANTDAANKGYVDGKITALASDSRLVHTTGDETIDGAKTFSDAATFNGSVSLANGATVPTGKTLTVTDAPTANTDAANKAYVDGQVAGATVVHTSGNETIEGNKTFTGVVTLPALTASSAATTAATKGYVDAAIAEVVGGDGVVHTSGAESITGVKTFTAGPVVATGAKLTLVDAPVADTDAANKGYVDDITDGTTSFASLRLQDENGDDWIVTVDSVAETLVIEKDTASAGA